jgi:hypothetical protein
VVDPQWHQATATWYGSAEGDGSDGKLLMSTASCLAIPVYHSLRGSHPW